MDITKVEEILALLHTIADSSISNTIAFISTLVSGIAVLSSIYFSHKTRVQYIDSLSPLLSFHLTEKTGLLYLTVTNTGQSEATDLEISFEELKNNGGENNFVIDEIFKNAMTLYPNEQITGYISRSGANIVTAIAPMIRVHVSFRKGNTKKNEQYSRWICYSGNIDENNFLEKNLEDISRKLNEISYSNNRMANYFEGKFLLKTDEINAYPYSSLYQDMKDAVNNVERSSEKDLEEMKREYYYINDIMSNFKDINSKVLVSFVLLILKNSESNETKNTNKYDANQRRKQDDK